MTKIVEREPCNPEGNTARRNRVCAERGCRPFEMALPEGHRRGDRWYYPDTRLYKAAREQGGRADALDRLMALNVANYKASQRGGGGGGGGSRGGGGGGIGGVSRGHGRSSAGWHPTGRCRNARHQLQLGTAQRAEQPAPWRVIARRQAMAGSLGTRTQR